MAVSPATDPVDFAVLALVAGHSHGATLTSLVRMFDSDAESATVILDEATRRLTLAAAVNRDEQLGLAIERCQKLYRCSRADGLYSALLRFLGPPIAPAGQQENPILRLTRQ